MTAGLYLHYSTTILSCIILHTPLLSRFS